MLFDSTVRKELARAFGATLVVILTIVLTQMLIQTLGKAADGAVAPQDVVLLLGFGAIKTLPTVLALSLFVAVVVSLGRMHTQLQRLAKAKTADKRQKLMDEHMKTMQENMGMATGMQSGMMDCPMMQGGMGMMGQGKVSQHDMMSKRMEMMMQGRMGMPLGEPPKPA